MHTWTHSHKHLHNKVRTKNAMSFLEGNQLYVVNTNTHTHIYTYAPCVRYWCEDNESQKLRFALSKKKSLLLLFKIIVAYAFFWDFFVCN